MEFDGVDIWEVESNEVMVAVTLKGEVCWAVSADSVEHESAEVGTVVT